MPITEKLSRRFYDVLGEDVANELVDWFNAVDLTPRFARGRLYRPDLRELNELNFARFDAKLEQRLAELRGELRQALAELRAELRGEIGQLRMDKGTDLQKVRTEIQQVRLEVQQVRSELLRWMFGFWVTTLLVLGGMMVGLR